jgi:hypothetical protein
MVVTKRSLRRRSRGGLITKYHISDIITFRSRVW